MTLDILMPGMSGFDVLRALRADPSLRGMPVVVVSVFSGREALAGEWVVVQADRRRRARRRARPGDPRRPVARARRRPQRRAHATSSRRCSSSASRRVGDDPLAAAQLCLEHFFEVALVDVGMCQPDAVMAALDLRGRRLRRSVVLFSTGDEPGPAGALDAEPVPSTTRRPRCSQALRRSVRGQEAACPPTEGRPDRRAREVARPRRSTTRRRRPTRASSSATPPTCARRSRRSARGREELRARTCAPCARSPTRSRRATPTPASTPSASPPTAWRSRARGRACRWPTTRRSSSASCCTTSARSRCPTRSSSSRSRSTTRSGVMQQHPVTGWEIVREIEFLGAARDVVRHHHERWDGERLPRRAGRRDDPARRARLRRRRHARRADHGRPYRPASPLAEARAIIDARRRHAVRSRRSSTRSRACPTTVLERIREEIG